MAQIALMNWWWYILEEEEKEEQEEVEEEELYNFAGKEFISLHSGLQACLHSI